MDSAVSKVLVVVADGGSGPQLLRCLTQVTGTVPAGVRVVAVSARFPRLPPFLSERVERVDVGHADEVPLAVDEVAAGAPSGTTVVAVAARAVLRAGWYEAALEQVVHLPHQIVGVGVGAQRLLRVLPGGVAPSRLMTHPLASLPGVREEPARRGVPAQWARPAVLSGLAPHGA